MGTPLTESDGITPVVGAPATIFVQLTTATTAGGFGVTDGLCGGSACRFDIAAADKPAPGHWKQFTYSPIITQGFGGFIGIDLEDGAGTNNQEVNWDIGPTPVPEPATMFLGGLGLIAFGYAARRRLFGQ